MLGTKELFLAALFATLPVSLAFSGDSEASPSAERGYTVLRTRPFLPPDFDDNVLGKLWTVWPEDLKEEASQATPEELRRLTFDRYGLHEPPDAPPGYDGPAIGYVDDGKHGWVMNCFACHAGNVAGQVIPGAPNTDIDLQSLVEDVRKVKLAQFKPFSHLDLGSLKLPLGGTRGTTNSVVFGIVLDGLRTPDMSVDLSRKPGPLMHHDMDAPAWWNVSKKERLYVDNFSPKNHRILMQFMLIPQNDRDTIYSWEDDFRDVLAYIESLEPPTYPGEIDAPLALQGKQIFNTHCATCHGTYADTPSITSYALNNSPPSPSGEGPGVRGLPAASPLLATSPTTDTYPEKIIPIDELATDPVRLKALSVAHRKHLASTWMSDYGRDKSIVDPGGYLAPPLDGVWASAPYFHNGSVPTLWHVLNPDARPKLWRRTPTGDPYDHTRIGLAVEELKSLLKSQKDPSATREVFNTTKFGKSAAGHTYPDTLTDEEKTAVLEYLKTL